MKKNQKILIINKGFGCRLRDLRQKRGFSQADLAKKIGYKTSVSVSNIESGKSPPGVPVLARLASVLNADLHWMITGQPTPANEQLEKIYYKALGCLAKYISRGLAQLLKERDSLSSELVEAKERQAQGEPVEQEFIEQLEAEIAQTQAALSELAQDQPWVQEAIKAFIKPKKQ